MASSSALTYHSPWPSTASTLFFSLTFSHFLRHHFQFTLTSWYKNPHPLPPISCSFPPKQTSHLVLPRSLNSYYSSPVIENFSSLWELAYKYPRPPPPPSFLFFLLSTQLLLDTASSLDTTSSFDTTSSLDTTSIFFSPTPSPLAFPDASSVFLFTLIHRTWMPSPSYLFPHFS